jgi:RNase P subunit RPR2
VLRSVVSRGCKMSDLRKLIRAAKVKGRMCPKCQALMLLSDIAAVSLVAEEHKFTCVDCNHIEVWIVEDHTVAVLAA